MSSVDHELASARLATDAAERWAKLERAHILSQPSAWHHTRVHLHMLAFAWETRDVGEIVGQVVRVILAGPASLVGRYPVGNTGRADVPLSANMAIPGDLAETLARAGKRTR